MIEKEQLTLMYKDFEVLSFEVDYVKQRIHVLEKLQHFDKAPYASKDIDDIDARLLRFFNVRTISYHRTDYDKIINATNSKDTFDLSFKGHGLSLSNHYWFKREGENLRYDDINFFNNKWDDTFGRAIINGDYEALKDCDLNVPDIVTSGWGVKGWIYDNGPKLYKLGIDSEHPEEAICEALASQLAARLFNEGEYLPYELKMINGRYASVSKPLITIDEELVPLSVVLPSDWYYMYRQINVDKDKEKEFFNKISGTDIPGLYKFFVKVSCFRSLAFVSDLHFDNLSVIRNMITDELRPAPLYDLGGAFGSSKSGKEFISNANKGTLIIIYYMFSNLDPNWDYSWYDPNKLIGFEKIIKDYLSKSDFYTPDIIKCAMEIYHQQKKTLDEMKEFKK